ncbi:DNA repair protein RecO [Terriglobus roseus]|uniref:DNA repair protein RecO n=1 Tax=Terriglobus roseus TaxID=392734 RepID=A0A1H4S8D9_9BACT|nr:DNA replication and repair protein RecO [Terriglobus roseus]
MAGDCNIATIQQSEGIVLRTWPFGEADLMVAVFTREQGVVRGVARHAMRSLRRFGGALEPMTYVRAEWAERPKQDVVRLDRFEILWSPLRDSVDYPRATALAFMAEVLEGALPDHAVEDDVFRLTLAAATHLKGTNLGLPVTYFALWITRLLGWMPDLNRCAISGETLRAQAVYYSPMRDGVFTAKFRPSGSVLLPTEAIATASRIFRKPLPDLLAEEPPARGAVQQLRRFAITILERHLEDRLRSARALTLL